MKKLLLTSCAALALVGCATYDDHYRGAPPEDTDVIHDRYYDGYYDNEAGTLRSPGGLDLPRQTDSLHSLPPPVIPPSGNRLRSPEPAPRYPTEAVPPVW